MTSISILPFEKRNPLNVNQDLVTKLRIQYTIIFIQFYRKVFISLLKNLKYLWVNSGVRTHDLQSHNLALKPAELYSPC